MRKKGDQIFCSDLKVEVQSNKVLLKDRTVCIEQNTLLFKDGATLKADNIIWATGYKPNYTWLDFPQLPDESGNVIHNWGISNVDGLYFLGLPWQHRRGSSLLLGVNDDAQYLYQSLVKN